jgi:hypothetical protein
MLFTFSGMSFSSANGAGLLFYQDLATSSPTTVTVLSQERKRARVGLVVICCQVLAAIEIDRGGLFWPAADKKRKMLDLAKGEGSSMKSKENTKWMDGPSTLVKRCLSMHHYCTAREDQQQIR